MTDWASIWMDETTPEEFRAECPHVLCSRDETHEGHGWRGTTREFGGVVEVTRTFWCEGKPTDAPTGGEDWPMRSIWMSETTPEEFRAEYPHVRCSREEAHEAGHVGCRVNVAIGDALRSMRGDESNAPAPSPVSAATEASSGAGETQEG